MQVWRSQVMHLEREREREREILYTVLVWCRNNMRVSGIFLLFARFFYFAERKTEHMQSSGCRNVQTLLFEIRPKIPNLLPCLDLLYGITRSKASSRLCILKSKMATIVLLQNRIKSWTYAVTLWRKNWARILLRRWLCWAFLNHTLRYTVYCLGDKYLYRLDPDIEFALRINHAGRSIVESGGSNRS